MLWAHREGDEELGVKREVAVTSRATTAAARWLGDAKDNHFTSADYDAWNSPPGAVNALKQPPHGQS